MICVFCKFEIDDDSIFCDQCRKEIFICPKCNKPGKGKMCTSCGVSLVSKKSTAPVGSAPAVVTGATPVQVTPPVIETAPSCELHLINKTLGIDLTISDGDIIGRTAGRFVNIFGKYSNISGKHLQINFDNLKGWTVTDLDSSNGTKYNNIALKPMQPQVLSDKSFLTIAYLGSGIEFYVEIRNKIFGKTGTVRG